MYAIILLKRLLGRLPEEEQKVFAKSMLVQRQRKETPVTPPKPTKPDPMDSYERIEQNDHERAMTELTSKHDLEKIKLKESFKAFPTIPFLVGILMALAIIGGTIVGGIHVHQTGLSDEVDTLTKRVEYLESQNDTLKKTLGEMVVEEHSRRESPTPQ